MRISYIIFFIAFSCKSNSNQTQENRFTPSTSSFSFIQGHWQRINDGAGETTEEHWTQNGAIWNGHAYTIKENDTLFQEWTSIFKSDSSWVFRVKVSGDSIPTDFHMTSITDSSFTCQNLHNEYPKTIFYSKRKDQLFAKISGGGPDVDFFFDKK